MGKGRGGKGVMLLHVFRGIVGTGRYIVHLIRRKLQSLIIFACDTLCTLPCPVFSHALTHVTSIFHRLCLSTVTAEFQ